MMAKVKTIKIGKYLSNKGIPYTQKNGELITKCIFNGCDKDSRLNEAHLYFNLNTGQYECKKCGKKGNIFTLAKFLGDSKDKIIINNRSSKIYKPLNKFSELLVEKCHRGLPCKIRFYLNKRGIKDSIIEKNKIGYGKFYGKYWITVPLMDRNGKYIFFKLREDPLFGNDKSTYPRGVKSQIYSWETLENNTDRIVICEGELDCLLLLSKGILAITSTHGAMTFKEEWIKDLAKFKKIYVCFDNDKAGRIGAEKVLKRLKDITKAEVFKINLPNEVGEGGDISDYFIKLNGKEEDLFNKFAKRYPEKIYISKFKPLSLRELVEILGLTIKKDEENKVITFLCELSSYTEEAQFNISYNAPSSTGKSYIPLEIAKLFPEEDVFEIGYCSPTAFFHDIGKFDIDLKGYIIDLSRKILIFLDQPHTLLLQHLRPLLSHDRKEITLKITDKTQKYGLKTKNILLKGYPSVIFCSAGLRIDEQEATRFLLLSPDIRQEKIREGIEESIKKEVDKISYKKWLTGNSGRQLLIRRIQAIKQENIEEIKIENIEVIKDKFFSCIKSLKPRHQRDIKRVISLIKSIALLNFWWRKRERSIIYANDYDIEEAFRIWGSISVSQEYNLPPYVYNLCRDIIIEAWKEKNCNRDSNCELENVGLTRKEISDKYYKVYGTIVDIIKLRQQILPMLETAGLIIQEPDINDKRKILISPTNDFDKFKKEIVSSTVGWNYE
jgi:5S rRNA maturation endonuclease (ribonuclease M5)